MQKSNREVFAQACDVINIYEGAEVFFSTFSNVDRNIGLLYAAIFAEQEICNGGFEQLFSNSTGILCPEAILGFEMLGMLKTSNIVQEASSLLGEPFPRDRALRRYKLASVDFAALNTKFFSLNGSEGGGFEARSEAFFPMNGLG